MENVNNNSIDAWLRTEGDINFTEQRRAWQETNLDESTKDQLADDARWFMHQSLSTPCINVLSACDGIYLVDEQGRRMMDFHGNSVHQVGYSHPRVLEAIQTQLSTLSFCPRRYTNRPPWSWQKNWLHWHQDH